MDIQRFPIGEDKLGVKLTDVDWKVAYAALAVYVSAANTALDCDNEELVATNLRSARDSMACVLQPMAALEYPRKENQ